MNSAYGRKAVQLLKNASIASFDMYGTLVHRALADPKSVFHMATMATPFFHYATSLNLRLDMPALRIASEVQARNNSHNTSNTREVTILEIYQELENTLHMPELTSRYMDAEILSEQRFTYASRLHKALFKLAQSLGKKVLIATDMYLDPKCIENILALHGYTKPYELFVSGYTCLPKYDGSFFAYVKKEVLHEHDTFVHLGDSPDSDAKAPAEAGLDSMLYCRDTDYAIQGESSIEASLAQGISQYIYDTFPKVRHSSAFTLGLEVYGPLLFGYMLWICKKLQEQHTEAVLFSLRDMQLIMRLLHKHKTRLPIRQALIPLFISRKAIAEAAMFSYDDHYLQYFCTTDAQQTLSELCAKLHINCFHYAALLKQCGLNDIHELLDVCDARLLIFISQILPDLQRKRLKNTHLVLRYMDVLCAARTDFTYVDLGYRGTIPVYLFRLQKRTRPERNFSSLMLAQNTYPHPDFEAQSFLQKVPQEYFENAFCELLESVLTANQKSTTGYRQIDTHTIIPTFSGTLCKNLYILSRDIRAGVELFVDTALDFLDGYNLNALTGEGWADRYLHFVQKPRLREALLFAGVEHDPHVLARDTKSLLTSTGVAANRQKDCAASLWKSGFRALSGRSQP